jgi:hypothetical protein
MRTTPTDPKVAAAYRYGASWVVEEWVNNLEGRRRLALCTLSWPTLTVAKDERGRCSTHHLWPVHAPVRSSHKQPLRDGNRKLLPSIFLFVSRGLE